VVSPSSNSGLPVYQDLADEHGFIRNSRVFAYSADLLDEDVGRRFRE
jgi:hypothetical protein